MTERVMLAMVASRQERNDHMETLRQLKRMLHDATINGDNREIARINRATQSARMMRKGIEV